MNRRDRFPLQTHASLVKSLFLAAFEADEPFPQVLNAALTRVYDEHGWDLVLGEPRTPGTGPAHPALGDLPSAADAVVGEASYGPEVERNVWGFITVRLGSLRLGTSGRFFEPQVVMVMVCVEPAGAPRQPVIMGAGSSRPVQHDQGHLD